MLSFDNTKQVIIITTKTQYNYKKKIILNNKLIESSITSVFIIVFKYVIFKFIQLN